MNTEKKTTPTKKRVPKSFAFTEKVIAAITSKTKTKAVTPEKKHKIGVSLSGGSALGYAHLGFLQAMEEAGYKPDCVVGTSMGAVMGMMYAAGYTPQQIKEIIKHEKMDSIIHLAFPNKPTLGGLVGTTRIQKMMQKYVPSNRFEDLKTKFYCCVSNMDTLLPEYHGEGDKLVQYVMASASMPGVFPPMKINDHYYVDGGIHDHLPIQPLLDEDCDIRFASNLQVVKPGRKKIYAIWMHALLYCSYVTYKQTIEHFTDVITIDPGKYWLHDFKAVDPLYNIGYQAGKKYFKSKRQTKEIQ